MVWRDLPIGGHICSRKEMMLAMRHVHDIGSEGEGRLANFWVKERSLCIFGTDKGEGGQKSQKNSRRNMYMPPCIFGRVMKSKRMNFSSLTQPLKSGRQWQRRGKLKPNRYFDQSRLKALRLSFQFQILYRDRQIHKPQVLWKWGETVALFCLLQAGECNFLSSYSGNLGYVDLPIPVVRGWTWNRVCVCLQINNIWQWL